MNRLLSILADVDPADLLGVGHQYFGSSGVREVLLICGTLLAASGLGVFIALYFFKKKKRRRHHREHHFLHRPAEKEVAEDKSKHHRKHRRRSKPPINPTLAQTGGLPPVRDEDSSSFSKY